MTLVDRLRAWKNNLGGDAYWDVRPDTYVPPGSQIETPSLLDDPERLRRSWQRMRDSDARWRAMSEEEQLDLCSRAQALLTPPTEEANMPDIVDDGRRLHVPFEDNHVANANRGWLRAWARQGNLKPLFNHFVPRSWRRCLKAWCWRGQHYQHRCWRHYRDGLGQPLPSTEEQIAALTDQECVTLLDRIRNPQKES